MRTGVPSFRCIAASLMLTFSATPNQMLETAKTQTVISDKMATLRDILRTQPYSPTAEAAREHLVALLAGSNRLDEALLEFRQDNPEPGSGDAINFKLLDYMLKAGKFAEVLRTTAVAAGPNRDFYRDMRLMEIRAQAFLAKAEYRLARESVDQWMDLYKKDIQPGTRYEMDFRSVQTLRRHIRTLERRFSLESKALFTAMVPDSMRQWSQRHEVPIVFFKLVPAHTGGQMNEPVLPGRHEEEPFFQERMSELNQGFDYVSGGRFSVDLKSVSTLYVKPGDLDPTITGGHLLTSRVYVHTLPSIYKWVGEAFIVLVDYRQSADGEAAYMGDGIVHISARKMQPLVLMHEILHGLGATHQDWNTLVREGHHFDPEDKGLMTFEKGEIVYLGLEEKNRALLGWPRVAVVKLNTTPETPTTALPVLAQLP